jgi:hypothetical protein
MLSVAQKPSNNLSFEKSNLRLVVLCPNLSSGLPLSGLIRALIVCSRADFSMCVLANYFSLVLLGNLKCNLYAQNAFIQFSASNVPFLLFFSINRDH